MHAYFHVNNYPEWNFCQKKKIKICWEKWNVRCYTELWTFCHENALQVAMAVAFECFGEHSPYLIDWPKMDYNWKRFDRVFIFVHSLRPSKRERTSDDKQAAVYWCGEERKAQIYLSADGMKFEFLTCLQLCLVSDKRCSDAEKEIAATSSGYGCFSCINILQCYQWCCNRNAQANASRKTFPRQLYGFNKHEWLCSFCGFTFGSICKNFHPKAHPHDFASNSSLFVCLFVLLAFVVVLVVVVVYRIRQILFAFFSALNLFSSRYAPFESIIIEWYLHEQWHQIKRKMYCVDSMKFTHFVQWLAFDSAINETQTQKQHDLYHSMASRTKASNLLASCTTLAQFELVCFIHNILKNMNLVRQLQQQQQTRLWSE